MSYNFPSPHRSPPRPTGPRRWLILVVILLAGALFHRYPALWKPIPRVVEKWREKMRPARQKTTQGSASKSPNAPKSRASQIPRVSALPGRPSFVPPQVTLPPVSISRSHASMSAAIQTESELTPANLPLHLPGTPVVASRRDERVQQLEAKIAKYPVFALYRALAQRLLDLGETEAAARVFRTQAALYRREGLEDAALILEKRAAQNETTIRVFAARSGGETPFTGAPLEPRRGCYLGAFIDRDDALTTEFVGDNWQNHRLPSEFEARVGRRHATVFTYVKWGNFPRQWLLMCKRQGVIPHIAWEPQNIGEVQDDAYLRGCAQFLRELNFPVFVRFASEMNGDWTPYHGNPALYRDKFRLVHRVLHRYAAKVATIWCVNAVPSDNIEAYYPGDLSCDWVGVNLYSTPFADNDRSRKAFQESPLALLEPIYRRYSTRKPIAICEYGASHQSAVDGVVRSAFATEKMALTYGALPLLYPRVKLIDYFSTNNLVHARAGRQLNNYRLTELPEIEKAYRQLTASAHFLTSFSEQNRPSDAPALREIASNAALRRGERLFLWVTSKAARPTVFLQVETQFGPRVIYGGRRVGKHVLDLKNLPSGTHSLSILVFDSRGRCTKRRDFHLAAS